MIAESREPCSSAEIAQDVDAHAVFMRRVLAHLVRTGIVQAYEGRTGGYRLARPASQITLADVYHAVKVTETGDEFALADCQNSRVIDELDEIQADIEVYALRQYSRRTLESLVRHVSHN
jgi:Rrf2 family protein